VSRDNEDDEAQRTEVRRSDGDAPAEFLWEGQVYKVRTVLAHEFSRGEGGAGNDEVWRVRASAGRHGYQGVFDLRFDWTAGRWTVTRITPEGNSDE
jgi:hypothetical protein